MFNNASFGRSAFESMETDSRFFPQLNCLIDFLIF